MSHTKRLEGKEKVVLDPDMVKFSEMSDKEAKEFLDALNKKGKKLYKEAEAMPAKMIEFRRHAEVAAKYVANKRRSKYFKMSGTGASLRKYKRHPAPQKPVVEPEDLTEVPAKDTEVSEETKKQAKELLKED